MHASCISKIKIYFDKTEMLNFLYHTTSLIVSSSLLFAKSAIGLWLLREVINLVSLYVLVYVSKDTSPTDMLQYIYVVFIFSLILFTRIYRGDEFAILLRLWRKLGLFPFHRPLLNLSRKISKEALIFFWIIPKLPYLILLPYINIYPILIRIRGIICLTRMINRHELVGFVIVISSTSSALLFSIELKIRIFIFVYTIIWGTLLIILDTIKKNKNFYNIVILAMLIPLPRGYSWVIKVILSEAGTYNVFRFITIIVITVMPTYILLEYIAGLLIAIWNNFNSRPKRRSRFLIYVLIVLYLIGLFIIFIV